MVNTKFTPTEEKLTGDELNISYWYITNKLLIRRILVLLLVLVDLLLVIYVLYGLANYYLIGKPQVDKMYEALTSTPLDYQYLAEISRPQPLVIDSTQSLVSNAGQYDLVAQISNPNELWYAPKVTYHFESGDYQSDPATDYVLPSQTKYWMVLGIESTAALTNPSLVIDSIEWEKKVHFAELQGKILNIEINDPTFVPPQQSGVTEGVQVSRVEFDVFNNSAYNFYNVDLKVLLYRAQNLVGVNSIPLQTLDAGETKQIEYFIYQRILTPNRVVVYPEVDILNPASFKAFDGTGEVK
jgi:hypothetical protein